MVILHVKLPQTMAEPFLAVFRKVVDQNPKRHFPKSVIQVASAKGLTMLYHIAAGFSPADQEHLSYAPPKW
jgi:hypothetical protein